MEKEILEGLAGLLNQPAEAIDGLFEQVEGEGEEPKLKSKDEILNSFSGWMKTRLDAINKQAKAREWTLLEKWVKDNGFDSDKQGTDLLTDFFEHVKTNNPGKGDGGEWEKKANKLTETVTALQKALAEKDGEVEKARLDMQRQIVGARLRGDVMKHLQEARWAGTDKHLGLIMSQFDPARIKYDGDGDPVLLNSEGEPMTDELMRPVKFRDHVLGLGELSGGFHEGDPGKGGPDHKGGGGGGNGIRLKKDMTDWEFRDLLNATTDPDKRSELLQARAAQFEKK